MFRNPITSLPASAITSGTFNGTFRNAGTFVLAGAPGTSRIEASGTELAFYAADGTTKLVDLDTSSGYGVITGGRIQTAAAGARWVMLGPTPSGLLGVPSDQLQGYSGNGQETSPATLRVRTLVVRGAGGGGDGRSGAVLSLGAPYLGDTGVAAAIGAYAKDPTDPTESANQLILGGDSVQVWRKASLVNTLTDGSEVWAADNLVRGFFTGTTDANGRVTVTHGLGKVPATVFAHPGSGDGGSPIVGTILTGQSGWTATTFVARVVTTAGAALASSACAFSWVVMA